MRKFPALEYEEFKIFKKLKTPEKIQDFLDSIPMNFEKQGDTLRSPLMALRAEKAHCMEGALLASAIFWYHRKKPLLLDLKTTKDDFDHVVALFKRGNLWGAVSKTNHAVLRYRDPVYKTIRELAMSYFNEYFLDSGKKTLRSFSRPFSLLSYGTKWITSPDNLWEIAEDLDDSPHYEIMAKRKAKNLRRADPIEIEAGKITEWKDE